MGLSKKFKDTVFPVPRARLIQNAIIINGKILNSTSEHNFCSYKDRNGAEVWFIDDGLDYCHTNIIPGNTGYDKLKLESLELTMDSTLQECYDKMLISVYPQIFYDEFKRLNEEKEKLELIEYKTLKAERKRYRRWKLVSQELKALIPKYFTWKKICELTKEEIELIIEKQYYIIEQFPLKAYLLQLRQKELK